MFSFIPQIQTGHTEITESICDKQNQISKAHPALGLGAVSQHLLEANGTGEKALAKILPFIPVPLEGTHKQQQDLCGSAEGCSPKTLPATNAHFPLNP